MKHLFTLSERSKDKWVGMVNLVMQFLKLTKLTKLTEQIFAESLKSLMSNFAGNESYESTEGYRVKSRITTTYLRLASIFALVFVLGVGNVWGADEVYKQTIFSTANNSKGVQNYTSTWTNTTNGFKVDIAYANNNNNGWNSGQIKIGNKTNASVGTIITNSTIDKAITKVELGIVAITTAKVNSIKLYSSSNGTSWTEEGTFSKAIGTQEASIVSGHQAANLYYKIAVDCGNGGSSNGFIQISQVDFYISSGGSSQPSLSSIEVSGTPSKKTYEQGETFDPAGLTVTAHYDDDTDDNVTEDVEWSFDPAIFTEAGSNKSVTVTASYEDKEDSEIYNGITVTEHVVMPGEYAISLNNVLYGTAAGANITVSSVSATKNDITIVTGATSGTKPYTGADAIRYYQNNYLTLSVPSGYNIKTVVFAEPSSSKTWNGSITVDNGTYTNASKSWEGKANSVTFSFGAQNRIATATVTYEAITPEVTVDPEELSYTAKQHYAVEGKTFTLNGANLSSELTLAASTGFNVSPTAITAEAAMAQGGVEVTVTPAIPTETTTPVEGTVTISGGGLANDVEVALSMAVTPTYAVGVAVNENAMGSATMDGGTITVYKANNETVALVATPASGHEFVSWTATSGISFNNANNAETTATITAAGTITANFKEQACTGLAAPILNGITKTYNSATIAWNAVANASEGYEVYVYNDAQKTSTKASDLVIDGTSFAVADLAANTTYYYTIMAVGDGTSYCDENNELLDGNFTTNDYPAATLTLSENGEEHAYAGSHKLNDVVTLPSELEGAGCKNKVLVGWSSVAVSETATKPASNYWDAGTEYTIVSTEDKLYAVFATEVEGNPETITLMNSTIKSNATGKGSYNTYTLDTYWTGKWMINNNSGTYSLQLGYNTSSTAGANNSHLTVANLPAGAKSVHIETQNNTASGRTFYLCNAANLGTASSGFYGSGSISAQNGSVDIIVTGAPTTFHIYPNGTAYIKTISVNYGGSVTYSSYTTSCEAQLPVLDAPTGLTSGTYYAAQTITLAATNDAAIYYSLDGNDPTVDAQHLYSEPFSLSERAITTIKAIAVKEGFETSEVAEAEYNINLPYDFAAFAALTKVNNKEYAVRGIISEKGSLTNNNQLPYYISADGQTAGQIKCHNGLKLNKETFTSADDVNVGDNVTVVGTWSTQYGNLNAGNWMLEYAAREHSAYTIEGELTANSFDNGDPFSDAIFANLSVKETFTNGYYKTIEGATFNAGNKTTWTDGDTELTVQAKLEDDVLTTRNFPVSVSSATLEGIALKADDADYQTKKVYYIGESFVAPTIIATLSDESSYPAVATYVSGFDNTEAGAQEVTVSYTRGAVTKTASYNITMKKIFDNADAPHTVAKAIELIEASAYQSTTSSTDYMWVSGIVSGFNGNNLNRYYISDNGTSAGQLYVFNGKYFNDATFTESNKLHVGDEVTLKATILNYQGNTPELTGSQVTYQLREPAFVIADIVAGDEFEAGYSEDLEVEPTVNDGDAAFTLSSGNTSVVTIVEGKLHAVAEGDAVITASRAATDNTGSINYKAKEIPFNVHVIAARTRYTVTFNADGGTGTDPVIANQLPDATVELPEANPYSKENNKFMGWQVSYNETVLEKALGESFTMPAANVTIKPKWEEVATCAISFMVNDAEVFSANAPQEDIYNISQVGSVVPGFTFIGWSETAQAEEASICPDIITSYTPEAGEESKVLYGIYSRVEEGANYGKYEKATAITEGNYLIVCENQNVVFDGSLTTLDAADNNKAATIADGILTLANADNYVFTISEKTGGYSIKSASNKYIGHSGNGNALKESGNDDFTNTISISSGDATISCNNMVLKYNDASNQNRFRYFGSGQKAIQLYKKNEGTILYTSYPVEKVTITFNANGGEGGCEKAIINKGSQLTICAEAPTKLHSEFTGWKNGSDVYEAGQAYTFDADITLTAQWKEAATYAVTYNANGATTGAVPTEDDQYAGDAFDVAAKGTLAKSGYDFQGWKYNGKLYAAGASFTMPASAVEFVAQWKKQNISTETMTLVTSESQLADGSKVVIAYNKGTQQYLAGQLSSKYLIAENTNVTFNGNEVTYNNANVTEWTLVKTENGWQLKNGTNYLGESGDNLTIGTTNATVWTITISNGEVAITSGDYTIRYNYNSGSTPRFKTYGSTSTMALPQLYASVTAITDDASISDLGYVEGDVIVVNSGTKLTMDEPSSPASITVKEGATVTVSAETHANNITVENGATIEVGATTAANNLVIQTTSGSTENQGKSGQLTGNVMPVVSGDLFIEIKLCEGAMDAEASRKWYCISAPFNVNMNGGFFWGDGTQMVLNTDFQLFEWDGDRRATGISGWKRVSGVMKAGIAYFIGFDDERSNQNIIKLKATNKTISNKSSINAPEHSSSVDDKYANWNGLANPNFRHIALNKDVQAFDHDIQAYTTYGTGDYNFVVGTPFFIKGTDDITIEAADNGSFRAPKREVEQLSYCVRIVREGKAGFDNQMYVRASEEASASYEEGHDLVTMNAETSNYGALLWTVNYGGKRLAIEEAPLVNDKASYALSLYAPADGAYRIETPTVREDASLYLTYEGNIIWDLSAGAYELELNKGATEGYGLMLVRKAPQVTTGVETVDNSQSTIHNCQKVILNDHVYILRDAQLYDVTGKAVK